MTSEQQVKQVFKTAYYVKSEDKILIRVIVNNEFYTIGYSHSLYTAWSNAMYNIGRKVMSHRGNYQKYYTNKKLRQNAGNI